MVGLQGGTRVQRSTKYFESLYPIWVEDSHRTLEVFALGYHSLLRTVMHLVGHKRKVEEEG